MSFEINKILGAILFALLVATSLRLVAEGIYGAPPSHEGATAALAPATVKPPEPSLPLPQLLMQASAEKGARVARRCISCHTFTEDGKNRLGPNLWNIINRKKASHQGFSYSSAMKSQSGAWSFEELNAFVENPRKHVRGTSMGFAGLRKEKQRADLLLYLRTLSKDPAPLP